jgi:hypothetical protein
MEDSGREEPLLKDPGTREQRMPGDHRTAHTSVVGVAWHYIDLAVIYSIS